MALLNASLSNGTPQVKLALSNTPLVKATLIPWERGVPPIRFMFNPTELTFEGIVETSENPGARTEQKKQPKVSFSYTKAYKVTISKIVFDTYEEGKNVVDEYIEAFRAAVRPIGTHTAPLLNLEGLPVPLQNIPNPLDQISSSLDSLSNSLSQQPNSQSGGQGNAQNQRTPTYRFVWGDQVHLRKCFIEKLTYKLTMFLPDGTPVRAVIDSLALKEIDESPTGQNMLANGIDRVKDSLQARISGQANFKASL
ncbi:hypothetical protein H6F95_07640 [Cyanobacteria bacterium FACHB-471]|nr:hypothetical protein [Cyanobacteria bacterium FACHB-471]